jgi:hypothetical protein
MTDWTDRHCGAISVTAISVTVLVRRHHRWHGSIKYEHDAQVRFTLALVICSPQATLSGGDKGLLAHFTASVFIGSILSHLMQRSSVRPFLITGIRRLKHFGQRLLSIILASRFRTNRAGAGRFHYKFTPEPYAG